MTLAEYLQQIGRCRGDAFGRRFRQQFADNRGTAELGLLAAPSEEEYAALSRAVEIMTEQEKADPGALTEQQLNDIAASADIDRGCLQIFLNGYELAQKRPEQDVQGHQKTGE